VFKLDIRLARTPAQLFCMPGRPNLLPVAHAQVRLICEAKLAAPGRRS
jgi:hypothetical protein